MKLKYEQPNWTQHDPALMDVLAQRIYNDESKLSYNFQFYFDLVPYQWRTPISIKQGKSTDFIRVVAIRKDFAFRKSVKV